MSAISGFCEKCNKFRKRHCDGNRNTCMSILFDTIEALQQENEQLRAKLGDWKYEVQCHMDEVTARDKENEQLQVQVAAMREALRKAREAIMAAWSGGSVNAAMDKTSKALTAIDKAIGGKEE